MKSYSSEQQPTYAQDGQLLYINFNSVEKTRDADEGVETYWECDQAVVPAAANRAMIIEAVIACAYPTPGAEFAAIINGGEDAAAHEAERVQAKALAAGWLNAG
jgi:hypothetical protein